MPWERNVTLKTEDELKLMRVAGRINAEALAAAFSIVRPGVTTGDLNAIVEEVHRKYGVYSPFKGYPGPYPYPASINASVNNELVHGIPGKRKLRKGDIISIDCGTVYEGFVGDSAFTTAVGEISPDAMRLIKVTEQALYVGISRLLPNNRVGDVSSAIQRYVETQKLFVVREYTGHGVGRNMHEGPQVPNYGTPGKGLLLKQGMTIALEPMVLMGTPQTRVMPDEWTVVSADGSLTCHFEHTVAITDHGPVILTALENGTSPGQIAGQLASQVV